MAVTTTSIITFILITSSIYALTEDAIKECNNYKECAYKTLDDEFGILCNGLSGCSEGVINIDQENGYIDCNGQTSCYNAHQLSSQGDILCQGYKSCKYAASLIAEGDIECSGWNSCDHQDKIDTEYKFNSFAQIQCSGSGSCGYNTMSSDADTKCDGDKSCFQSKINSGGDISCDADKSCARSQLFASDTVWCNSKGGCYESDITSNILNAYGMYAGHNAEISAQQINGFGHYSLSYAVIDSHNMGKMEVNLFGDMAGYGANIICRENDECNVYCQSSGCNGMNYICLNGAKCHISPSMCSSQHKNDGQTVDGVDCPTWKYEISQLEETTDIALKANIIRELENDNDEEVVIGDELNDDIVDGLLSGNSVYDVVMNDNEFKQLIVSKSIIYSNVITGFIIFLVTIMMVDCYFRAKYGSK